MAMATMMSVPTMALPNPPPCSSGAGGSWVRTVRLSFLPPRHSSIKTTEKSGIKANTVIAVTSAVRMKSTSVRGRRSDRSRWERSTPSNGSVLIQNHSTDCSVHVGDGCTLDNQGADDIDDQRDTEQNECRVHQNADLLGPGLGEVVCQ